MLSEHDVAGFRSAREALRTLAEGREFDGIFCDLMMPSMTGADFHAALTLASPGLMQRVVFITGGVFGSYARQFLKVVKNQVISKPFEVDTLRSAIARVVSESAFSADLCAGQ
jgi:CheY-like chemotaxis protein